MFWKPTSEFLSQSQSFDAHENTHQIRWLANTKDLAPIKNQWPANMKYPGPIKSDGWQVWKDLRKLHCRVVGWITDLGNCWNTVVLDRNKIQVCSNCCRNGQSSIQPILRKVPVMCVSKCQKFLTFTKQIGTIKSYLEAQMNDQQEEGTQLRSSTWRSYWSVHTSETPNTYKV